MSRKISHERQEEIREAVQDSLGNIIDNFECVVEDTLLGSVSLSELSWAKSNLDWKVLILK